MKIYKRPGLLLLVFYLTISAVWGQKNVKGSGYVLTQQRETADFTVQPKGTLAEGTYNETVIIQGSNDTKSELQLKFSVIKNSSLFLRTVFMFILHLNIHYMLLLYQ